MRKTMASDKAHFYSRSSSKRTLKRSIALVMKMQRQFVPNWYKKFHEKDFSFKDGDCVGQASKFEEEQLQHPLDQNSAQTGNEFADDEIER